ncbi:NAD(P)/FAD-dependent oxidoreductase [Chitinophaga sp. sic0106]|uniref:FAD-dependent oxidoreductase n=1 Tax=Chitinophaga sp. sic0106 TaxID=2854785 RepID=UPI001C437911|nr:NAD(P)/FAD-dependent oxidoreductase [Chitinophaga sp. sic0106]MBV7532074.1 FAD-dependent oxidoreductase [Chitinophaga sp. sic0106]
MSGENTRSNTISRKEFLRYMAIIAGGTVTVAQYVACMEKKDNYAHINSRISGASAKAGHMMRDQQFGTPAITEYADAVIVGGGVAGLSAARSLHHSGFTNFRLLELEPHTGGNASYGSNQYSAYPLGAHYLPIPNIENQPLLDLLAEAGILTHYNADGLPVYNETDLCYDPEERLYIRNRWQEGLIPQLGISQQTQDEIKKFLELMETLRRAKGSDNRYAFDIPADNSSTDASYRELDQLTMEAWLQQQGYHSEELRWYLDYCCRDDYGAGISTISAWAAIHYFASRKGKAGNADSSQLLTWPQGNGRLAQHLQQFSRDKTQTGCVVYKITPEPTQVLIDYYDINTHQIKRLVAKACIMATPQFVTQRLIPGGSYHHDFVYSPWLVANITLERVPESSGYQLSWDNVIYQGKSLGYVNAQQQRLTQQMPAKQVITYYLPLDHLDPVASRKYAIGLSPRHWVKLIADDLETVHPGITELIGDIDITIWGHGMIRPHAGFITGEVRAAAQKSPFANVFYAHSDLSGISIFEEAFYHGNKAANALAAYCS